MGKTTEESRKARAQPPRGRPPHGRWGEAGQGAAQPGPAVRGGRGDKAAGGAVSLAGIGLEPRSPLLPVLPPHRSRVAMGAVLAGGKWRAAMAAQGDGPCPTVMREVAVAPLRIMKAMSLSATALPQQPVPMHHCF